MPPQSQLCTPSTTKAKKMARRGKKTKQSQLNFGGKSPPVPAAVAATTAPAPVTVQRKEPSDDPACRVCRLWKKNGKRTNNNSHAITCPNSSYYGRPTDSVEAEKYMKKSVRDNRKPLKDQEKGTVPSQKDVDRFFHKI